MRSVQPRGKTALILTVKMETRYPVEGLFGSELPATCNHCGVMTASKSQEMEILWAIFAVFFTKKRPLMVKFLKFCPESLLGDTDRRCCVPISQNLSDGKSVKLCVIRMTKKQRKIRLLFKLSLLCGSSPKSARTSPQHLAHTVPDFIRIGSLSVIAERTHTVFCA